ncbi:NAD-dependent epimerase/dehydratase family protein [Patescibacteria group bacterium]|nr:NAD-dependent epimerase/dehydratase family protein [Patescibacteria group bacterium]
MLNIMSSICITGIGGYLGLATAFRLVSEGYSVVGIGSNEQAAENLPPGVVYAGIDIRDPEALAQFFTAHQVTTVYHFAAIKYVGQCEADPVLCYDINTNGTKAVLAAMKTAAVPKIIYASTYAVYDWSGDTITLTEKSSTNPATVYGKSKLQSEQMIAEAHTAGEISRYHILRYGNIVGAVPELPTHTPQSFLDKMLVATKTGETISLTGGDYTTVDGTVARDFIDIRDAAAANVQVLSHPESGIYNVSSYRATTLKQLMQLCETVTGTKISVTINPKIGNEPSSITIDNTQLITTLGFQPKYSLIETIEALAQKLTS